MRTQPEHIASHAVQHTKILAVQMHARRRHRSTAVVMRTQAGSISEGKVSRSGSSISLSAVAAEQAAAAVTFCVGYNTFCTHTRTVDRRTVAELEVNLHPCSVTVPPIPA